MSEMVQESRCWDGILKLDYFLIGNENPIRIADHGGGGNPIAETCTVEELGNVLMGEYVLADKNVSIFGGKV